MSIIINGTGSYIPPKVKLNSAFLSNNFIDNDGNSFGIENQEIIEKFQSITGIKQRLYVSNDLKSSDIATEAAKKAIKDSKINSESIDYIILAHNIGDINYGTKQMDAMPALAARVKANLEIKNPSCVAYDILFGCPGWLEGMIQAKSFIKSGMAKRCLVIGTETLSRVIDPSDRDGMIFADGAGAVIIESSEKSGGILSNKSATYSNEGIVNYIYYGESNSNNIDKTKYIKMQGHKVYEFALSKVPNAMKECLDESGKKITDLKKIFIHQANLKMEKALVKRFYKLYDSEPPNNVLPTNIERFGNSSVATIPTLFDLVIKENYGGHKINNGDLILFASVGAGMNINALTYQF
ncbi:MAG: 3-oxoacyl-ACP synthase [Flavobacteriaceae bacterium]|nr:3-oxoacyl-ACP synthase [Flavobacteriaceae bacterium]|tara:strand:+ start:34573 stop:35631 length:1059 start_codon:yes stop_codon:yes gene_type:complete